MSMDALNPTKAALLLVLLPALALATGCKEERDDTDDTGSGTGTGEEVSSDEQALVSDGAEIEASSEMASQLSAIPTIALAGQANLTAEDAAAAQAGTGAFFQPEGCLTVDQKANVVTYTFAGCTGPWGLVELNGQETATFTAGEEQGSIAVALASKDLTANAVSIEHAADVVVTFPEGGKQVTWKGGFTSETPKGAAITHTSDLVWTVDAQDDCRTTNGTTTGSVGERGVTVTYEELSRCGGRGMCAAGSITVENARGLTMTLELDGTATATVTGPRGREWEVPLQCTAM